MAKFKGSFNYNPGSFQPRYLPKPSGQYNVGGFRAELSFRAGAAPYNPGGFQARDVPKPSGSYNPGGGYENRDLPRPSGDYNPGRFELREVQRPTGAYNPGSFQDGVKDERDPWGAYSFSIMLDEVEIGSFLECSGMKSTAEVVEIEEGGLNGSTHKRAGRSKWENLMLKHGECDNMALLEWRDRYLQDGFEEQKKTKLSVILRDNDGSELRRFDILRPWPVSWEGPALNGGSSELAIHSLEIAHEGIMVDGGPEPTPPEPTPDPVPDKFETEPIQFEYDSAELTPEGEATVAELSKELDEHPDVKELWVEGHTCNMGSHAYNQKLSAERAEAVAARLRAQHPDKTIHSRGYSYDHPVASNANSAGRSTNRRTEVWTEPRGGTRAGELQ